MKSNQMTEDSFVHNNNYRFFNVPACMRIFRHLYLLLWFYTQLFAASSHDKFIESIFWYRLSINLLLHHLFILQKKRFPQRGEWRTCNFTKRNCFKEFFNLFNVSLERGTVFEWDEFLRILKRSSCCLTTTHLQSN